MKKFMLLTLSIASLPILSMEKDKPGPFLFNELPVDMQRLILVPPATRIKEIVSQAKNVNQAIIQFKELSNQISNVRLVSKDILQKFGYNNLAQFVSNFLDTLNAKYPGQQVRIARALNNNYAQEWLAKKNPKLSYKPTITASYKPFNTSYLSIWLSNILINNQNNEDGGQWTKNIISQLNKGLDPNALFAEVQFQSILQHDENLPLIKTLVAYGLDLQGKFLIWDTKQNKFVSQTATLLSSAQGAIRNYLEKEGAH